MKELTIQEKAKAYDEALKVLHKYDGANIMFSQSLKEEMFPELKESKDERIRKAILELVKQSSGILEKKNQEQMLDWLEKQGEQNLVNTNLDELVIQLEKTTGTSPHSREIIKDFFQKAVQKYMNCLRIANGEIGSLVEENYRLKEKQGEQKPLYIRFGDIPNNEKSKIYRGEEEIGEENGVSVYPAFESNGDIVIGLTFPITRTSLHTQQHLLEYDNRPCYLVSGDCVGKGIDGEPLIRNICIIKQLNNYRIKEIEKQGEQKSLDDIAKEVIKDKDAAISFLKSCGIMNENGELADEYKIEQGEQNPAWSEEDAINLTNTIRALQSLGMIQGADHRYDNLINWLKFFKNRVFPQLKQWSEEDENRFRNLIYLVEHSDEGKGTKEGFVKFINRLKSLKEGVQIQNK